LGKCRLGGKKQRYGARNASTADMTTDPLFMKIGAQYYFYHNDHIGTPQKMTSVSGAVVWSAKYSSFGKAVVDASSTIVNPLRFPGQYDDTETGLHYNWFRYYEPEIGRYLAPDPIGVCGGINFYRYSINSPLNEIDPLGLFAVGVLDTKNQTLTLRDLDTNKIVTVQAFTGGYATPDGIVSPGTGKEVPMPDGGYFIVDNPNPQPGHGDWYGLLYNDKRIDDYANDYGRGGFRLHLGGVSWGCATVDKYQTDAEEKWKEIKELIKNTKPREVTYIKGPHWWNRSIKIPSYGVIYKK
jgi:RHS repeat-associated protein